MKLPTRVKRKVSGRKMPRGTGVVMAAAGGAAVAAAAILKGREAAQKAATLVLERAERKDRP